MTIETVRYPKSKYLAERIIRKDWLKDPASFDLSNLDLRVNPSNIDFNIDPRLIWGENYTMAKWFSALPVFIDKSSSDYNPYEKYTLSVYLKNNPRVPEGEDFNEQNIHFDLARLYGDVISREDSKIFEIRFWALKPSDAGSKPWFTIFRRERFGRLFNNKSPIELAYERGNHVHGIAFILLPNEGLNTRFVRISGNDVFEYSSQQAYADEPGGK